MTQDEVAAVAKAIADIPDGIELAQVLTYMWRAGRRYEEAESGQVGPLMQLMIANAQRRPYA